MQLSILARSRAYHRAMLSRLAAAVLATLLTACAAAGRPTATATPTTQATATPTIAATASPMVTPREDPEDPPNAKQVTVTGTLGADSIEGGCAYLQTNATTRYEVIYPKGWQVTAAPLELRNPDGKVVATGGDTITVRGQPAVDMASTCQIGPIFKATEVVTIDR